MIDSIVEDTIEILKIELEKIIGLKLKRGTYPNVWYCPAYPKNFNELYVWLAIDDNFMTYTQTVGQIPLYSGDVCFTINPNQLSMKKYIIKASDPNYFEKIKDAWKEIKKIKFK